MPHPVSLEELCRFADPVEPWRVDLVRPGIGGRRTGESDLAAIDRAPQATALTISGLDQRALEMLVRDHGARFTGLHFWKCPRIADLTPLEAVPGLTHVAFYWNQRATRLWDFARTPHLRGLRLHDFTRLHDLGDLARATSLVELQLGDTMWRTSVFHSFAPLAALTQLQHLSFIAKRVEDGVQSLAALVQLDTLTFPTNQFTAEQVAWLRARLPASVTGRALCAVCPTGAGWAGTSLSGAVIVVGKRKPTLDAQRDRARLDRYIGAFERLVDEFRRDPERSPD